MRLGLRSRRYAGRAGAFGGYVDRILGLGPIAYWTMGEASGTTMVDIKGGFNGAYAAGVTLGNDGVGGVTSAYFNGTPSAYAQVTGAALTNLAAAFAKDEFTVACWAKVSGAGVWTDSTQRRIVYGEFSVDGANNHFYLRKNTTANQVRCGRAGTTHRAVDYTTAAPTGWFHIALRSSLSGDSLKLYFNGSEVGTPGTGLLAISGSLAKFQVAYTEGAFIWSGYLSHLVIFARALTAAEIAGAAQV